MSHQQSAPSSSRTQTVTGPDDHIVLRLRPEASGTQQDKKKKQKKKKPRVRWTEDVIDNEDMGKKKSKICCIFHPQREFGEESDSDSSSSSSGSSDSSSSEDESHDHSHCNHGDRRPKRGKARARDSSPNAYERQPDYRKKEKKEVNEQEEGDPEGKGEGNQVGP